MNNSLIGLIFLFFLASCSSGIRIHSKHCKGDGKWSSAFIGKEETFKVSGFGLQDISLRDLLLSRDIKCDNILNVNVSINRTLSQSLLTIMPNYSSQNVIINYR